MPSDEDIEDFLLSCRYGDLDDVKQFVEKFGSAAGLADVRDENGNTVLHMVCGNGHEDTLDYLLPFIPPSLLSTSNEAGSTPLHWAVVNSHLSVIKKLVLFPGGPGAALIDQKNNAGRSPLGEAELAGWDEGAQWLVSQMNLDEGDFKEEEAAAEEVDPPAGDIEVEIQDADGGVARMNLSGGTTAKK